MKLLTNLAALALTLAGFTGRASAQCFTPDGLDPVLPVNCFPAVLNATDYAFGQKTLGICWRQCGIDATANYRGLWSQLTPSSSLPGTVDCGWYNARLQLFQGVNLRWSGSFNVMYSRTWYEGNSATPTQVWRYLVNGDMIPASLAAGPCAVPPCSTGSNARVRFSGYIDYAVDCLTGVRSNAWMITHGCDAVDHAPGYPRAGVFHPDRYYTFVGPSVGFVPGIVPTIEAGVATQESVRRWDRMPGTTGGATCQHDEPLAFTNFLPFGTTCLCSAGGPMWYEADISGAGVGGTTFSTIAGSAAYKSVSIGSWTLAGVYPGIEEVRWTTSDLLWTEGCTTITSFDPFYGVTTAGGDPAWQIDVTGVVTPLGSIFIDHANSIRPGPNTPVRNVPFRSYHILNLNL